MLTIRIEKLTNKRLEDYTEWSSLFLRGLSANVF
nr:MAG TPA: hypothetical protein [Bacteriophage sp.]